VHHLSAAPYVKEYGNVVTIAPKPLVERKVLQFEPNMVVETHGKFKVSEEFDEEVKIMTSKITLRRLI